MSGPRWFHGGFPGLRPGDFLLPPAETGRNSGKRAFSAATGIDVAAYLGPEIDRLDMVYLTCDRAAAFAYAGASCLNHRGGQDTPWGAVYTAEPAGEWEPDPDMPEIAIQCPRARILAVYDPVVLPDPRKILRGLGKHIGGGAWRGAIELMAGAGLTPP